MISSLNKLIFLSACKRRPQLSSQNQLAFNCIKCLSALSSVSPASTNFSASQTTDHRRNQSGGGSSENNNFGGNFRMSTKICLAIGGILGAAVYLTEQQGLYAKSESGEVASESRVKVGERDESLPTFTEKQLAEHNRDAKTIWVSYKNGIYDITEFVANHPGGDKILLAAGSSIDSFWNIYAVHHKDDVYAILESFRVGNLRAEETTSAERRAVQSGASSADPYASDPKRHPLLKVLTRKPFNAEAPRQLSADTVITPNEFHFVRNHLPVPHVDPATFELQIVDELSGRRVTMRLDDIKRQFAWHTFPVTLQCSGNKRRLMNVTEPVQGLMWDVNAISTAEWTGVRLKDVLAHAGFDLKDERVRHVCFDGLDADPTGATYGASIPKEKVDNDLGDVIIAFQMNGVDLPLDFGYPLRAIVPGITGARSVKWLHKITLSASESSSHWQKSDYKLLPPQIKNLKEANFDNYHAIQESPVQSAICEPADSEVVRKENDTFVVKGFAFSGGGKSIISVLVSLDGGHTWHSAKLKKCKNEPLYRTWSWTLWELEADIPQDKDCVEIVCVATDSDHNTQPETVKSIWNARGLINNSWHRIKVNLQ